MDSARRIIARQNGDPPLSATEVSCTAVARTATTASAVSGVISAEASARKAVIHAPRVRGVVQQPDQFLLPRLPAPRRLRHQCRALPHRRLRIPQRPARKLSSGSAFNRSNAHKARIRAGANFAPAATGRNAAITCGLPFSTSNRCALKRTVRFE